MNRRQEKLAAEHPEHQPNVGRYVRGGRGRGITYGADLWCRCGWKCRTNTAPSAGGRRDVLEAWERHVANPDDPALQPQPGYREVLV